MNGDLTAEVQRVAAGMIEAYRDMTERELDYSEESSTRVEAILNEMSYALDGLSEERVDDVANEFGCYVLEVGRRNHGGRYLWHPEREAPVLVVGEAGLRVAMLTWDKTKGRLLGDMAENISFFYAGFAERVADADSGVDALYV